MPEPPEGVDWSLVGGTGQMLLLDGGRASGSGGCNRFTGAYEFDGERISFEPLASTRMACEPELMRAEVDYFLALGRTAGFLVAGGELVLLDDAGAELLRFVAAETDGGVAGDPTRSE